MKKLFTLLILLFLTHPHSTAQDIIPKYEMRAAWIATVVNIDYPSRPGLTTKEQQDQYIGILDSLHCCGINAVIVQIRPTADAFYPSKIDPWSYYLTGEQGRAPSPAYDPLKFMIDQAHLRGMEFHAWLNPYRVSTSSDLKRLSSTNQAIKNPSWRVLYGGKYYFNPGIPQVRDYLVEVVKDLCVRYDIDGVHLDDYFYPYPVKGVPFPDAKQYAQYGKSFSNVADWRRDNVNQLVRSLHHTIDSVNPDIKFGISPFGIYRRESPSQGTLSNYDDLYADVLLWTDSLWVDYLTPQLYWEDTHSVAPYGKLLSWWAENITSPHLYIGHGLYNIDPKSTKPVWRNTQEIINQINTNRLNPKTNGSSFYSAKYLVNNTSGISTRLKQSLFRYPALVPAMKWKDNSTPTSPHSLQAKLNKGSVRLTWQAGSKSEEIDKQDADARYYLVYRFEGDAPINLNDPKAIVAKVWGAGSLQYVDVPPKKSSYKYAVSAVSRNSIQSEDFMQISIDI